MAELLVEARLLTEVIRISRHIPKGILKQAKDSSLPVTIRIGKGGVTEQVLVELREQLGKRGLVKLKAKKGGASERERENPKGKFYLNWCACAGGSA